MRKQIDRLEFLAALEAVRPAVADREKVEQGSCVAFEKGRVYAYDDEMCVNGPSGLPEDFAGAVPAKQMIEILKKLDQPELVVSVKKKRLHFASVTEGRAGRETLAVRLRDGVSLPYRNVEAPAEWLLLGDEFAEAVAKVAAVAAKDEDKFVLTCVHITPTHVEASDDGHACRWTLPCPIEGALIRKASAMALGKLGVCEASETQGWVHFRTTGDFVVSCRRYEDSFPTELVTRFLSEKGEKLYLPRGLEAAAKCASIAVTDADGEGMVAVRIADGLLTVRGLGAETIYGRAEACEWAGPPIGFRMPAKSLEEIAKNYESVTVSAKYLVVDGGPYRTVYRLSDESAGEGAED